MIKLNLNDIVKFELTEHGESLLEEFKEKEEQYEIKEEDYLISMSMLAMMDFLSQNGFNDIIDDDRVIVKNRTFFLNCNTKVKLTESGVELYGSRMLSNHFIGFVEELDMSSNPDEWHGLIDGQIEIDETSHHTVDFYVIERGGHKVFCMENEGVRITISNPRIQPFDSYKFDSMKDKMYFYYNMTVERNDNYKCGSPRWKNVCSQYVYESGVIQYLTEFINEICALDMEKEGHQSKYHTQKVYRCTDMLSGFCNEDNYEIARYKNFETGREYYDFTCLLGDLQISSNLLGVRFNLINKHDLKFIKKWSDEFVRHAEEVTRRQVRNELEFDRNNKKILNGKIYVYEKRFDENGELKDTEGLDFIVIPRDKCEIKTLEMEYDKNIVIAEIKENSILTTDGEEYQIKDLLRLYHEFDDGDEELSYGKEECKKAIAKRLEDVLDKDSDYLMSAAINTCWLCREEHGFEDGRQVAREILEELKTKK